MTVNNATSAWHDKPAPMSDQVGLMFTITDLIKEGKNDEAAAAVCQLNQIALERGYGDNYWLNVCNSMIEINKYIADNNINIDKVLADNNLTESVNKILKEHNVTR